MVNKLANMRSLNTFTLGLSAGAVHAFTDRVLGGAKDVGTVSWSEKSNVLTVTRHNELDCDSLQIDYTIYANPYAVNDQIAPNGINSKQYCDEFQLRNPLQPETEHVIQSGDMNPFDRADVNDAFSPCISNTYLPDLEMKEFYTVVNSNMNMGYDCATMTKGKLSYGVHNGNDVNAYFYRSYNWKHHAMNVQFVNDNENVSMFNMTYFMGDDCNSNNHIDSVEVDHSFKNNWYRLALRGEKIAKSISINDECINLRKDIQFSPSAKFVKLFQDEYGDDTSFKSIKKFTMSQDSIFEPTKYQLFFERDQSEMNTTNPDNNINGYHIHNNPLNVNDHTDCDACGNHYNPYQMTSPWDETSDYGSETGDLARRYKYFGSRTDSDDTYYDMNLPLHGDNTIIGRSVVFHRQSNGGRVKCANLVEKKHYKGRYD